MSELVSPWLELVGGATFRAASLVWAYSLVYERPWPTLGHDTVGKIQPFHYHSGTNHSSPFMHAAIDLEHIVFTAIDYRDR